MILTEQILKVIRQELDNCNILTGSFLSLAPSEQVYPFCSFSPYQVVADWTFSDTYNYVYIQFSVFDNSDNKNKVIEALKCIERLFNRTGLNFLEDSDTGIGELLCSHRVGNERIEYIGEEGDNYWMGVQDYVFVCIKGKDEDFQSSSSSSSSSS